MKFEPAEKLKMEEAPFLEEFEENSQDGVRYYRKIYFDALAKIGEIQGEEYEDEFSVGQVVYGVYLYRRGGEEGIAIQRCDRGSAKRADYEDETCSVFLLPFSKLSQISELVNAETGEASSGPQANQ